MISNRALRNIQRLSSKFVFLGSQFLTIRRSTKASIPRNHLVGWQPLALENVPVCLATERIPPAEPAESSEIVVRGAKLSAILYRQGREMRMGYPVPSGT